VGCLLPIAGGKWGEKNTHKNTQKKQTKKHTQKQKTGRKYASQSEKLMLMGKGADKREKTKEKGRKKEGRGVGWHTKR
jgi:hypothetical protein